MPWLKAAIARIRQILPQVTASPTQPAGPVPPEPTTPLGNRHTAQTTSHPHPYVLTVLNPNSDPAPSTTLERKRGSGKTTASAGQPPTADGSKSQTPASRSHRPAKPVAKPAKNLAAKTKTAAKHTHAKAPAKTHTVSRSGGSGS
jgi:hypothetical protein